MPQFDVYRNVAEPGYLLYCQSDALSGLNTRIVVPLLPPDYAPKPGRRLNPILTVGHEELVMMTHFASEYMVIMNAFDMLLTGY